LDITSKQVIFGQSTDEFLMKVIEDRLLLSGCGNG